MTRSSANELFTPYKEPEREFRSSKRHFKTLSLDELRSPNFNLLSDQEYSDEEVAETMAETMHNGTSRVRSTETSDGLASIQPQLKNLGREIKKVNKKVYAAQVGCEQCKGPHYTKDCPLKEEGKTLEEAYYTQFGGPFQGGGFRATALEIRAPTDAAIRNQGVSIKTLEIQIGQMSKSISTTIKADSYSIRRIGSSQYAVSTGPNSTLLYKSRQTMVPFPSRLDNHYCEEEEGNYGPKFAEAYGASHINDTIPRKEKDLGSFTLPCYINNVCFDNALFDLGASIEAAEISKEIAENSTKSFLSTARAKIDFYKRKITLRVGEERIIFTSVKPASSLIKRVYMLSLRERMELDLEARLMGETLVLNRSLDPFLEDYIELNDLNEPFELRRNQGYDLIPTIKEGKVIEEFRTRDDELDIGIDDYPSYCDYDKKIHINFLEDMDAYHDDGMGYVIFGEPFLREVGIKTKHIEGIITLYNSNDEVTYQMVRSHLRFKCHTNEQCKKILPLLKVSEKDEKNGISHAYQKLKGFYKGVLNLGPNYIRNMKTE
ncbi:hypothetical protein Tco_0216146 [Tanacetum coccineum]